DPLFGTSAFQPSNVGFPKKHSIKQQPIQAKPQLQNSSGKFECLCVPQSDKPQPPELENVCHEVAQLQATKPDQFMVPMEKISMKRLWDIVLLVPPIIKAMMDFLGISGIKELYKLYPNHTSDLCLDSSAKEFTYKHQNLKWFPGKMSLRNHKIGQITWGTSPNVFSHFGHYEMRRNHINLSFFFNLETCQEVEMTTNQWGPDLEIQEVWHYEETPKYNPCTKTGGLFADYINTFLQLKQQVDGWPWSNMTEQEQEEFDSPQADRQVYLQFRTMRILLGEATVPPHPKESQNKSNYKAMTINE
uniref:Uncharacterized protein n=1 Tax=Romanomermis culicivorax TaxID=13658 RepID=A0A915HPM7_ROMCU